MSKLLFEIMLIAIMVLAFFLFVPAVIIKLVNVAWGFTNYKLEKFEDKHLSPYLPSKSNR